MVWIPSCPSTAALVSPEQHVQPDRDVPLPLQCVLGEPSGPGQGGLGRGACWHDPDWVEPELLLPVSDLVDVGWCSDHELKIGDKAHISERQAKRWT